MISLCPVCESAEYTCADGKYYCDNCGNVWEKQPQPLQCSFPYPFGTILYSPNRFGGKVAGVESYKVIGYAVNERGMFVDLLPQSYDGVSTLWRIRDLYLTEKEAWEA